jgi:integrase
MKTTVDVVCYKSKVLANSESPLMLRITKDRKLKYSSIGISVNPIYWDFEKNKPKRHCPDKERIERVISEQIRKYREQILDFQAEGKEFTTTSLFDKVNSNVKNMTVKELFASHITDLKSQKRRGYAQTFMELYNSLMLFNGHLDIYFSDIDVTWLKRYETWQRGRGLLENTIGKRFRTLRVLYNLAIEQKHVKSDLYPFNAFKVSKLHQATAKRAISKDDIARVAKHQSNEPYTRLAIDLFVFSYFMGGINFGDIANLKLDNIVDGRLVYVRRKTHKLIRLPMQPKAQEIVERYQQKGALFLFPIFSDFHKTEQQQRNRLHKVMVHVNKRLKEVGKELKLPIDLTTYVARHSFATVLKRSGVSTSIICESLGHSSEKVTQYYLDSFENSQIDEAMQNLL